MIVSMTGFAAVAAELPGVALAVELRSVNHRYLDLQIRLPDELRGLETALRERLLAQLKRGKVECRISLARPTVGATGLAVDGARVGQLAKAAAEVTKGAHEVSDEVRRAGHSLRAHFEQAWEALTTSKSKNGDAPKGTAAKAAAPKGAARGSTTRRPRAARRTSRPATRPTPRAKP